MPALGPKYINRTYFGLFGAQGNNELSKKTPGSPKGATKTEGPSYPHHDLAVNCSVRRWEAHVPDLLRPEPSGRGMRTQQELSRGIRMFMAASSAWAQRPPSSATVSTQRVPEIQGPSKLIGGL